MKIRLVGTEFFHADRRKDRQWDRHDKANSRFFRSCSTAPETLTNNLMSGAHSCCCCCVSGLLCPNFSRERNRHFLIDGRCSPHWLGMLPKLTVNSQRHSVNLRVLSALVWGWQLLLSISWVSQSMGDYIYIYIYIYIGYNGNKFSFTNRPPTHTNSATVHNLQPAFQTRNKLRAKSEIQLHTLGCNIRRTLSPVFACRFVKLRKTQ
jgi:hypothetical protein